MESMNIACTPIFNTLIGGFCKSEKLIEANELVKDMVTKNFKPDHVTFVILVDYHCKIGMMEDVEQLFLEMLKRNLMSTVVTYTTLLHGYNSLGERSKMFSLFEEMMTKGIEPNGIVCTLVNAQCKEGNSENAFKFCNELVDRGLFSRNEYEVLINP